MCSHDLVFLFPNVSFHLVVLIFFQLRFSMQNGLERVLEIAIAEHSVRSKSTSVFPIRAYTWSYYS